MADHVQVQANDLAKFRREVRRHDREIGLQFQRDLRGVAQRVAAEAAGLATGRVAQGYRGTARGTRGIVRNTFLPARFLEFGFHPGGGDTFVEGRNYVGRVLERREDMIVDELGDAVERAAQRMGWR